MNSEAVYSEAINSTIDSLKGVYTVLLALSLGEAFSQLVEGKPDKPDERVIRKDRIPNLFAFLFLIVPFIQGMDRYFFQIYKVSKPVPYAAPLLIDCMAFTVEGSLFFVLARSLAWERWERFHKTVILLSAVDLLWGLIVWQRHLLPVAGWLTLDIATLVAVSIVLWARQKLNKAAPIICLAIILVRTVLDYVFSWGFYFPPVNK
jgi:hypothetical protein